MNMWDCLTGINAILNCNIQTGGSIYAFHHSAYALHSAEEIIGFCGVKIRNSLDMAERADQDMAGEEGLEVDKGEAKGGAVEDLEIASCMSRMLAG